MSPHDYYANICDSEPEYEALGHYAVEFNADFGQFGFRAEALERNGDWYLDVEHCESDFGRWSFSEVFDDGDPERAMLAWLAQATEKVAAFFAPDAEEPDAGESEAA